MTGLGDSIYQRCYVRELARRWDVYLENCWPQLYADLDIKFVRHPLRLRTQEKNVRSLPADTWSEVPKLIRRQYLGYSLSHPNANILTDLDRFVTIPPERFAFDLPPLPSSPVVADQPVAVIRPVTERDEWLNQARNCDPRYVADAARVLRSNGFHVVSVADIQPGSENLRGTVPEADTYFHAGELGVVELMALIASAAVVAGPVGWILPAAIAARTPCILIAGGHGAYNRPDRLTDPRLDLSRIEWLIPSRFCMCANMRHDCKKAIPGFDEKFRVALESVMDAQEVAA